MLANAARKNHERITKMQTKPDGITSIRFFYYKKRGQLELIPAGLGPLSIYVAVLIRSITNPPIVIGIRINSHTPPPDKQHNAIPNTNRGKGKATINAKMKAMMNRNVAMFLLSFSFGRILQLSEFGKSPPRASRRS